MSQEITVRASLSIISATNDLVYQPPAQTVLADFVGTAGPTPGAVSIATSPGTNVSLAALTSQGGWCRMQNLDPTNYVTYGKWDGTTFHPLGELRPGEFAILRLSRSILSGSEFLRFVANVAACQVWVEAFDA